MYTSVYNHPPNYIINIYPQNDTKVKEEKKKRKKEKSSETDPLES